VGCVEFFGGLLLILGLGSRLTGLVLTGNMFIAYLTADREALLSFLSNPGKFYGADPYTFLFAAVLILIFGPGWIALDTWIAHRYLTQASLQERSLAPSVHADAA
jgi:putative oxidoreductase